MLSEKRRVLRDEESKLHEIERKIREKQVHERTIAERLKSEYEDLRSRFEQMAFELRFSIEDELKIYSRLLDELMKKSNGHSAASTGPTGGAGGTAASTVTYATTSSRIRSGGIDEREGPSSFHQTRTTSSSGPTGNTVFDLGGSSSSWQGLGTTSHLISAGPTFRSGEQEFHEGSSVTRSSSYSNLS